MKKLKTILNITTFALLCATSNATEKIKILELSLGADRSEVASKGKELEAKGYTNLHNPELPFVVLMNPADTGGVYLQAAIGSLDEKYKLSVRIALEGKTPDLGQIFVIIFSNSEMAQELARQLPFEVFRIGFTKEGKIEEITANKAAVSFAYSSGALTAEDIARGIQEKYKTSEFQMDGEIMDLYLKTLTQYGENYFIYRKDNFVRLKDASKATF